MRPLQTVENWCYAVADFAIQLFFNSGSILTPTGAVD